MASLKTASILLAPLGKAIQFVDAIAANPEKLKYVVSESFKNMVALSLCVAIWVFRCFLQSVNAFFPSSVSTKALVYIINTNKKAEEEVSSSNPLNGSAIGRALSQVLALMNETPVSSRKYEFVRDLAEKMIDENSKKGSKAVQEVNRLALSAGFSTTLQLLTSALRGLHDDCHVGGLGRKLLRQIPLYGHVAPFASRALGYVSTSLPRLQPSGADVEASLPLSNATAAECVSAEKLAAELLWLVEKLAECGDVEEAILQWSEAASLASLSMSAHPRVQGSLVRVSVFLFKELAKADVEVVAKVKMLMTWLPLLSYATNGVLSSREKADVEAALESTIEGLGEMEDKEKVLSNWLHHFIHCASSDWPNLGNCYGHWCNLSRSTLS